MMLNSFLPNSNAKASTQRPSTQRQPRQANGHSMSQQPQPFRFWLPYRSNAGSWRQQPRPQSSRPVPSPPEPQPPPPTPAEPLRSRAHAKDEDIPIQAESSDESDTIPVQSSDSSQPRGGQPSMTDLELTLSEAPPSAQEQRSGRDGNRGNDTKIAISGFPRSRLFDGAGAPYRQEIEDGLVSLAGRDMPASRPENGQGYRVITLAGHNVGASMVVGNGGPKEAHAQLPSATKPEDPGSVSKPPAVAANVNNNVQNVNNSSMEGSTCSAGNPGVHVDIKKWGEDPAAVTPTPRKDEKPKEPKKRPPLVVPARPRRCLRALMMENGSDTAAAGRPKPSACRFQCVADRAAGRPKPSACRFQCVADHTPPGTTSNGGGAGGNMSAEDGGKASTAETTMV